MTRSPQTNVEINETAEAWTNVLIKTIPVNRLHESFNNAAAAHEGTFPINVFEIVAAYKIIREDEEKQATANRLKALADSTADYNSPFYEPCAYCFGCGFKPEIRRIEGVDTSGVSKCYGCDYWQRYKEKHNL